MSIALISLIVLYGLRKAGVNIPYFDNVLYAMKMKVAEMKESKLQQSLTKTLTTLDKPMYKTDKMNKATKPINTLHSVRTFSGKLKI